MPAIKRVKPMQSDDNEVHNPVNVVVAEPRIKKHCIARKKRAHANQGPLLASEEAARHLRLMIYSSTIGVCRALKNVQPENMVEALENIITKTEAALAYDKL